mmetsp:Transcript_117988/g.338419  ORF Transcript_117988/g.338419 Transcript_117988/m.338419 type:complete len:215 (+) Transcript_117988:141-785(+)
MEVTVVETGNLPADAIISFRSGNVRRQAHVEKDKAISLSCYSGSDPVRVDLMTQIGSHTFDMEPGREIYEVPIGDGSREVRLKVQIREAPLGEAAAAMATGAVAGDAAGDLFNGPCSPSRKLQSALSMRSYLDNHDVLRNVQEMLEDMVMHRPEDPLEFMIKKLEQACGDDPGPDDDDGPCTAAAADGQGTVTHAGGDGRGGAAHHSRGSGAGA